MSIQNATVTESPTAAGNLFVSSGDNAITTLYLCNQTVNNITCNLFLVNTGFDANSINKVYSNVIIAAGDTLILETERIILADGDSVRANAAPAGLVATANFVGI